MVSHERVRTAALRSTRSCSPRRDSGGAWAWSRDPGKLGFLSCEPDMVTGVKHLCMSGDVESALS